MPNQSNIPSSPAILGLGMQNLARASLIIAEGPYRAGDVMKWYGDCWLRVLRAEIRMHQPQFTELLRRILRKAFPSCEELYWRQLQLVWFWERGGCVWNTSVHRASFTSKQPFPTKGAVIKLHSLKICWPWSGSRAGLPATMKAVMTLASSQAAHAIWTKGEVFSFFWLLDMTILDILLETLPYGRQRYKH